MKILLNPRQRQAYLRQLLEQDGMSSVVEDTSAAYCPISLTSTPAEMKQVVAQRQRLLVDEVLAQVGITGYDPNSAKYSPDKDLSHLPQEIYVHDSGKILSCRYFVGFNLIPSTGMGVETEKAVRFNRIAVMLHDVNVRVSRMQPHRVIYLQYHNFARQVEQFQEVFRLLQQYEPGMGLVGDEPVLLGFHRETDEAVNLEELVYSTLPDLQYQFDASKPTIALSATNADILTLSRTSG